MNTTVSIIAALATIAGAATWLFKWLVGWQSKRHEEEHKELGRLQERERQADAERLARSKADEARAEADRASPDDDGNLPDDGFRRD